MLLFLANISWNYAGYLGSQIRGISEKGVSGRWCFMDSPTYNHTVHVLLFRWLSSIFYWCSCQGRRQRKVMKISANQIRWAQMNWSVEDTPRTSDPWTNYIYVVDSSFIGVLLLLVEIFERKQEGSIEIQIEPNEFTRTKFRRMWTSPCQIRMNQISHLERPACHAAAVASSNKRRSIHCCRLFHSKKNIHSGISDTIETEKDSSLLIVRCGRNEAQDTRISQSVSSASYSTAAERLSTPVAYTYLPKYKEQWCRTTNATDIGKESVRLRISMSWSH